MTSIPHPDKPCEAQEIREHLQVLLNSNIKGKWDMEGVMNWLKYKLPQLTEASDTMVEYIDDIYPDTVIDLVKREDEAA
ncbi:hypothetical protein [Paenibacillus harenae]|uniref:hypothetical protein n=1 Tax=Paenibacillus harenae TaxID=306543 RepID=UPI00278E336B|nr:hypothetical protein [Paenibacillus harenae]MDQ0062338.1 hypothetical protein [Paenibacillus harenae]